jgi:hypothetical protein
MRENVTEGCEKWRSECTQNIMYCGVKTEDEVCVTYCTHGEEEQAFIHILVTGLERLLTTKT